MSEVRAVLTRIGEVEGFGWRMFAAVCFLPALVVALVLDLAERAAARRLLALHSTTCPAGHPVDLMGAWTCGACGFTDVDHAWARCRCGARASRVQCPCGLSVPCPIPPEEGA